jgi:hypothetical protein
MAPVTSRKVFGVLGKLVLAAVIIVVIAVILSHISS